MARIAEGHVLTQGQLEVTAAGGEHRAALDGGGPHDPVFHQAQFLDLGIALVAGAADRGVRLRTQNQLVGAVDAA